MRLQRPPPPHTACALRLLYAGGIFHALAGAGRLGRPARGPLPLAPRCGFCPRFARLGLPLTDLPRAADAAQSADEHVRVCAAAADRVAAAAENAGAQAATPDARDAEAAWNEATASARIMPDACQPRA